MFDFIFEIYDKRYHCWYVDYKTSDIEVAEIYFNDLLNDLLKEHDKGSIRMITKIKE